MSNMFEQTIGVEIEMNNVMRKKAARLAAKFFGTDRYEDTHTTNGYSTWSAWDEQGREWKFQKDVSIHGLDSQKCEMVTPVLKYEDVPTLQGLIRFLRKNGAKSDYTRGCGIHVHIGADGHTPATLRNLSNMMESHEDLLIDSLKISPERVGRWCQKTNKGFANMLNSKRPKNMEDLANVWYEGNGFPCGRTQHYNSSRYHMLNLHSTFTKGTIEFRMFQFEPPKDGRQNGLHAGWLKTYILLCLALCNRAKEVKYVSRKQPETMAENPRYVMRYWLQRLGMIGDEFDTARKMLIGRLEGNSDCKWAHRSMCEHRAA